MGKGYNQRSFPCQTARQHSPLFICTSCQQQHQPPGLSEDTKRQKTQFLQWPLEAGFKIESILVDWKAHRRNKVNKLTCWYIIKALGLYSLVLRPFGSTEGKGAARMVTAGASHTATLQRSYNTTEGSSICFFNPVHVPIFVPIMLSKPNCIRTWKRKSTGVSTLCWGSLCSCYTDWVHVRFVIWTAPLRTHDMWINDGLNIGVSLLLSEGGCWSVQAVWAVKHGQV